MWSDQLQKHGGDVDATLEAFTSWLWSGNGFSKERYTKLGLQRSKPPKEYLEKVAAKQQMQLQLEQQLQQQGREELELVDATTSMASRAFGCLSRGWASTAARGGSDCQSGGRYRDPAKKEERTSPPATVPFAAKGGLLSGGVREVRGLS